MEATDEDALVWNPPHWWELFRWPLPHKGLGDRALIKMVALATKWQALAIHGLEHVALGRDPFILVANHGTRRDVIVMPTLLMLRRGGRPIHFFADWNFMLIPGVRQIYRCGGTITVMRKSARPRILNAMKPLFADALAPNDRARRHLEAGRSVGVYPEGTVNRDPERLLAGRIGAARLSLEVGVPVVPMGLRFPESEPGQPVTGPMEIVIGPPRHPPAIGTEKASLAAVREWHAVVMSDIARLSGKNWNPHRGETR